MRLIFDIETAGCKFESLSETQQEFLFRYAEKEKDEDLRQEKREEAIRYLNLYPFTASICSIALLNIDTEKILVLYKSDDEEKWEVTEKKLKYSGMTEMNMLISFWNYVKNAKQIISFNGRQFDLPFLMLRSAILKVKPSKNFLKSKYNSNDHIDLLDKFTNFGSTKKFNLDFYCKSFGIESPKTKGITGMEINELYNSGKVKEIAVYCGEDVIATYELYKIWNKYLNI